MTVIVGVVRDGRAHLGADAYVGYENWQGTSGDKLIKHGELVIGTSGDVTVNNALRHRFILPERDEVMTGNGEYWQSDEHYISVHVLDAIVRAFEARGKAPTTLCLLLGYRGVLYRVDDDYSITRLHRPYEAIGAGQDYALGALHVANALGCDAEKTLEAALEAAVTHSPYCLKPYSFASDGIGKVVNGTH